MVHPSEFSKRSISGELLSLFPLFQCTKNFVCQHQLIFPQAGLAWQFTAERPLLPLQV